MVKNKSPITNHQSQITKKLNKLLINTLDMALKRRARRIVEELNPQNGDKILDVGCGDGFYLHLLSNLGLRLRLTGADVDAKALESAKKNLKEKRIKFVEGDLMKKLPFKDNSYDKIVMSEVVEHLPDDVRGLKEVYRVLKPGGVLVLSVPNASYPFLWDPINWILEHFFNTHIKTGFWAGIWNQHERLYTRKEIQRVVKRAGFKIICLESLTYWCLPFSHYLINIGARILARGKGGILVEGANKFEKNQGRNVIPAIYSYLASKADKINRIMPHKNGVSVLITAESIK